jgi:hypothetical protein
MSIIYDQSSYPSSSSQNITPFFEEKAKQLPPDSWDKISPILSEIFKFLPLKDQTNFLLLNKEVKEKIIRHVHEAAIIKIQKAFEGILDLDSFQYPPTRDQNDTTYFEKCLTEYRKNIEKL